MFEKRIAKTVSKVKEIENDVHKAVPQHNYLVLKTILIETLLDILKDVKAILEKIKAFFDPPIFNYSL